MTRLFPRFALTLLATLSVLPDAPAHAADARYQRQPAADLAQRYVEEVIWEEGRVGAFAQQYAQPFQLAAPLRV